jgi:hypothetical protein
MSETINRGPGRPAKTDNVAMERSALRGEVRASDPREAARKRAAEIMGHLGDLDEGIDKFYIPADAVPDGWSYEWKRHTIFNQPDPTYEVNLARLGWTAVPAARHPEMMPSGSGHVTIYRDGMRLYERPLEITTRFKDIDNRKARDQIRQKREQLGDAPVGHFGRDDARVRPNVKSTYEPIPIAD